jgi:UDP-galactopyranose mutase
MPLDDYQGVSIMNYADQKVPYTRILEPKHFYRERINLSRGTVVMREYPCDDPAEPYYPVSLKTDQEILAKYQKAQSNEKNVIFGGRLAEYKYYDMYQVISRALKQAEKLLRVSPPAGS